MLRVGTGGPIAIDRRAAAAPPPRKADGVMIIPVIEERPNVVREPVLAEKPHDARRPHL